MQLCQLPVYISTTDKVITKCLTDLEKQTKAMGSILLREIYVDTGRSEHAEINSDYKIHCGTYYQSNTAFF